MKKNHLLELRELQCTNNPVHKNCNILLQKPKPLKPSYLNIKEITGRSRKKCFLRLTLISPPKTQSTSHAVPAGTAITEFHSHFNLVELHAASFTLSRNCYTSPSCNLFYWGLLSVFFTHCTLPLNIRIKELEKRDSI